MITEDELVELRLKLKDYPLEHNLIAYLLQTLAYMLEKPECTSETLRGMLQSVIQYVPANKELKIYRHMNNIRCCYRINSYIMKMAGYTPDLKLEASDELFEEFISYCLIWLDKLGYCDMEYLTKGL